MFNAILSYKYPHVLITASSSKAVSACDLVQHTRTHLPDISLTFWINTVMQLAQLTYSAYINLRSFTRPFYPKVHRVDVSVRACVSKISFREYSCIKYNKLN